jgi:hypothetical protein
MSAQVIPIERARRKRAARLAIAQLDDSCACGCGAELGVNERIAWDSVRGIGYRLECWLRAEGLA